MLKSDGMMHSAGGLVASSEDLATWIRANVGKGLVEGRRVLPESAFEEAHIPHAPLEARFFKFNRNAYGLGWYHAEFAGENLMHHFGGFDGYQAHISFMPEHQIGVVALTNSTAHGTNDLPHLVASYAYKRMLGKPNVETRYQEELDAFIGEVQARLRLENQLHRAAELMPSEEAKRLLHEALRDALAAGVASQGAINGLGYEYFNDGTLDMALVVFEFNVGAFPDAANPHDSYGEALEKAGRLEEAEKAYARAVELSDPSSRDYNTFLENLRRVRDKK